jgi:iron complex outermembrane recepter protein
MSSPARWICLVLLPAAALAQEERSGTLQEVIVTAQKREQSLQDVSLAVSAIDSSTLTENFVLNLEDVQHLAPSMSFGNSLGFAKIFIRGIGLNEQTSGIDPSVALHVDGAVINQPVGHFTSVFDLDRIEILRGPQGTLYGRNATGGSVNLITAKPTDEFEGYARATVGNYDLFVAEAALSGPLTQRIKGRVAMRSNNRNGYGINEATGTDVDDADTVAARAHLLFDVTDDLELLLSGEIFDESDRALGLKYKRETFTDWPTLPAPRDAQTRPLGLGGFPERTRNFASEFDPSSDIETWGTTATLTWRLNDQFTLVNIGNYREVDSTFIQDLDMSAVVNGVATTGQAPSIQTRFISSHQVSDELQLNYSSERLNGLFALFYFKEGLIGDNRSGQTPGVRSEPIQRVVLVGEGEAESFAAFTHLTYDLNDTLALKLGARHTHEKRSINNNGNIQLIIAGMLANTLVQSLQDEDSFDELTMLGGVEWRPREDALVYYTYSEGFKAGVGLLGQFETGIAEPETVQSHEVGIKSEWLNGRVTANAAAFHYNLQNLQLGRTLPDPARGFINRFENAAGLEGDGVETEFSYLATDRLRFRGAVDYLDARFTRFDTINQFNSDLTIPPPMAPLLPVPIPTTSYAGNRPRNSPEWAYSLSGEYDAPLAGDARLTFAVDVSYKSEQFFSEFNDPVEGTDDFTLLDARISYRSANERWTASVWGKNLTDELVESGSFAVSLSRTIGRTFLPPRTYGVSFDYQFR